MSWIGRLPGAAFRHATSAQYLTFLKLLGVEQRQIAQYLSLSPQLVSFWCRGDRPVPTKYRAALRDWAERHYVQALARQQQDAAALPSEALRVASNAAFDAPLLRWAEEVWYASGLAEQTLRETLRALRRYEDQTPWTAADLREMERLCLLLDTRVKGFAERYAETMSPESEEADEAGD
jgi:transcriptional regulator with XRE-family HTH domain